MKAPTGSTSLGAAIDAVMADAYTRLAPIADEDWGWHIRPDDYGVEVWQQTWGDTSCGSGRPGGQAITSAYTVVVSADYSGPYAVYHAFRFAHLVRRPTQEFLRAINDRKLPGASGGWARFERAQDGAR